MTGNEESVQTAQESSAAHRKFRFLRWGKANWVAIALVLVAVVYGGAVTVLHDEAISPIDEVVYLDYTYKVFDQGMLQTGEKFGDEVAQVIACEGVVPHGTFGQVCGSNTTDFDELPNQGYTTGASYLPVYFWITRIVGDPLHEVFGIGEVTAWRLSGLLWLSLGLIAFVGLLRRWEIPNIAILAVGVMFVASPFAWWTYTYLSTDVTAFLLGSLMLSATIDAVRGRRSGWLLLPLAVLAVAFKITNLLVLGLVLLYLIIHTSAEIFRRRKHAARLSESTIDAARSLWRPWFPIAVSVAVAAALQVAWMKILPLLAATNVQVDQGVAEPFGVGEALRLAVSGLEGTITHNPAAGIFPGAPFASIYAPMGWICVGAVVGALMVFKWKPDRGPLIWAVAIASVTVLPALAIVMYVMTNSYFPLPARYAAGILPGILLVAALMLRNRLTAILILIMSGGMMAVGLALASFIGVRF